MSQDRYDDERLAALLRELREPPRAWVDAAKQAPAARREIDELLTRAEADQEYRAKLLESLERALEAEGYEPDRKRIAALRAQLIKPEGAD